MADVLQIITGILFLALVFILTRFGMAWRIRRACVFVVRDLERRNALDHSSAVELTYAKSEFFRMGLRDFRPKAVQGLVESGVLGMTEHGRFFLRKRLTDLELERR